MQLIFIEKAENIIFCGTPGVGKTNLAVSIGIEAAKQRYSVYFISFHEMMAQLNQARHENKLEAKIKWLWIYKLLIIDEVEYEKIDLDIVNLFFNLVSKRYEKTSTIISANLIFSKCADTFVELTLTNVFLDCLHHHCSVIKINGPSYIVNDQLQNLADQE